MDNERRFPQLPGDYRQQFEALVSRLQDDDPSFASQVDMDGYVKARRRVQYLPKIALMSLGFGLAVLSAGILPFLVVLIGFAVGVWGLVGFVRMLISDTAVDPKAADILAELSDPTADDNRSSSPWWDPQRRTWEDDEDD